MSLTIVRFVYSESVAVLLTSYVCVSKQVLPVFQNRAFLLLAVSVVSRGAAMALTIVRFVYSERVAGSVVD